ncbi:uncharacterized protein CcaverHIS019_0106920 [Cutaneotrichosporon cavernicola]|uniref:GST N-terminal domain-containing protein n=1 Tax=Cutaneotrichosporon cavernicola TaxID=279322 RepID=A0AA48I1S0_9TREE|nr:uncharacterized protein CcaverHIS019_0106920 [Cutaneotrichosporon cavernicola]BEI87974.1 hypothetical protein CcaverHIS019_0106920 [Cutaneotrichosporon cavernicola]BEI95748.1 hypothetical protein CcaverHIS631_0106970 [Cutaneotrichosporon cavernicola]BEJ03522.1 hypothetical protein CcaverHIS641_0106970 [Cutaneotrichosporon cavernicola]
MNKARVLVHHLQNSRSARVLWALEELGEPYDVRVHYRTKGWFAGSSLRDVSPLGKSPAVQMDGKTLTESAAILGTLLRTFPSPSTENEPSPNSLFWSHFSEGSLMLYLQPARFATLGMRQILKEDGLNRDTTKGVKMMNDWFQNWAREHATGALGEAETWLAGHELFSGSDKLGLGDFMMFFPLNSIAHGRARPNAPRLYQLGPATDAWVERMRARPAFQAALARMKEEEEGQKPAEMREAEARKRAEEATIW